MANFRQEANRAGKVRKAAAVLFLAGGVFLVYLGGFEYLESRLGQTAAKREFQSSFAPAADTPARPPLAPADTPDRPWHPRLGEAIGKLTLPRLGAELYVVEGDGDAELRRGPGHISGSAMPGQLGNCIIAGHRDTHFRVLEDVRRGDTIVLRTRRGLFSYRVESLRVVSPDNTSVLEATSTAVLSLVTCYPFYYVGNAPERFVVEARMVGALAADASPRS